MNNDRPRTELRGIRPCRRNHLRKDRVDLTRPDVGAPPIRRLQPSASERHVEAAMAPTGDKGGATTMIEL